MEPDTNDQAVATLTPPQDLAGENQNQESTEPVTRYVVVEVNHNHYGMPTASTVELMSTQMAHVTRVPHSPAFILGVINHRGTIIPVVDMRSLLGFEPRSAEAKKLSDMFEGLKADHVNWLNALQEAVCTNSEFTMATDPTKCKFGKWYESVLAGSSTMSEMVAEDPILKSLFDRFDKPHRNIHGLAQRALTLKDGGQVDKAIGLINDSRETDLSEMCEIFDQILEAVATRLDSMMVITEVGSRKAAIAVDGVSFVADCEDRSIEPLPDTADNTEFLSGLVHQNDGSYILIADLEHIYNIACPSKE